MAQAPPWTLIFPGKIWQLSGGRGKSEDVPMRRRLLGWTIPAIVLLIVPGLLDTEPFSS
jgi:hypothetical protein